MDASPGIPENDMAAMTLAGSNMESAIARLKRLRSMGPQGASSFAESTSPSDDHVKSNTSIDPAPGPSLSTPGETLIPRLSGEEQKTGFVEMNGPSSENVDSPLGESLPKANAPQHKMSTDSLTPTLHQTNDWNDTTVHGPRQNTSVALSKMGKRRGRPVGSKNKPRVTTPQNPSVGNQHQLLPKPSGPAKIKKDATPEEKLRSAKISEAMKASWARRRGNESGGTRVIPSSEGSVLEKRVAEDVSGQGHADSIQSNYQGIPRKLFEGQHAIRSGSGHKLAASAPRRPSAIETYKDHRASHNVERIASSVKELAQLPDTSGGPETDDPPLICKGDDGLIKVFRTCVYPTAIASINRYKDTVLSSKTLKSICKQVAKDTINDKFVAFLQQSKYKLDRPQRKLIRKYVKSSFAAAANLGIERIQKQMLQSQSTRQKSQVRSNDSLSADVVHRRTTGSESLTVYQQEYSHGSANLKGAPKSENINYNSCEVKKTAQPGISHEKKPLPGQPEPVMSLSPLETPVKITSFRVKAASTQHHCPASPVSGYGRRFLLLLDRIRGNTQTDRSAHQNRLG
ncbi:MAG: hypothetical protein Q9168_005117 [Polycauliona sp. 1 TL-2023]